MLLDGRDLVRGLGIFPLYLGWKEESVGCLLQKAAKPSDLLTKGSNVGLLVKNLEGTTELSRQLDRRDFVGLSEAMESATLLFEKPNKLKSSTKTVNPVRTSI